MGTGEKGIYCFKKCRKELDDNNRIANCLSNVTEREKNIVFVIMILQKIP